MVMNEGAVAKNGDRLSNERSQRPRLRPGAHKKKRIGAVDPLDFPFYSSMLSPEASTLPRPFNLLTKAMGSCSMTGNVL